MTAFRPGASPPPVRMPMRFTRGGVTGGADIARVYQPASSTLVGLRMEQIVDLFLHLDTHLTEFVATYGRWVYAGLFIVIFAETGLVVTPILPGDSLLFAAGALAASGALDIRVLLILLIIAAVLGDAVNYSVGDAVGPR